MNYRNLVSEMVIVVSKITIVAFAVIGIAYVEPPILTKLALWDNPFSTPISLGLIFATICILMIGIYPDDFKEIISEIWIKRAKETNPID